VTVRTEPDPQAQTPAVPSAAAPPLAARPGCAEPLTPARFVQQSEDAEHALPEGHPAWVRDRLAISAAARALLATLQPVVLRVRTFWDHRLHAIVVAGQRLSVDQSGSYRLARGALQS
jgi:hypothetical protein